MMPFAILFMFNADPLFGDFYKLYGMLIGLFLAVMFEERYAPIVYDVAWWKKLVRIVVGLGVAYVLKETAKNLSSYSVVWVSFIIDIIRYITLVFAVFGFCPVLFKKCKI